MADATTPQCFTLDQPISELEKFQENFESQLESVYDATYTEEEWSSLVAQYDLELLFGDDAEAFATKPDWNVIYYYNKPDIEPFGELREKLLLTYYPQSPGWTPTLVQLQIFNEELNNKSDTIPSIASSVKEIYSYFENETYKSNSPQELTSWISDTALTSITDAISADLPGKNLQESNIYKETLGNLLKLEKVILDAATGAAKICPEDMLKVVREGVIKLFDDAFEVKIVELERAIDRFNKRDPPPSDKARSRLVNLENVKKLKKLRALQAGLRATVESFEGDNLAYSEQCLLLTFIKELIGESQKEKFYPYVNRSTNHPIRIAGNPFAFTNSLVIDPSQKELFRLRPEVVSQLIPYIRLYKVVRDKDGKDVETPITFDTNIANDLGIASGALQRQRGYGVGLKDFTFSYEGTDPFSAKKAITAKLSMFASTFDDILKQRNGFKYADLALKTGPVAGSKLDDLTQIEKENAEKLNFRLKAVIGWNVPKDTFVGLKPGQKKAIYNSYITVYLTPTIHTFNFDETGAVIFDIEYLAYIEDAFAQSQFNIFASLTKEKIAREAILNFTKKQYCGDENKEFEKLLKFDESFVQKLNLRAYSDLVSELAAKDKIYYLNLSYKDIGKLLRNPTDPSVKFPRPYSNSGISAKQVKIIKDILDNSNTQGGLSNTNLLSAVAVSQDNNSVPYFYIKDIVAVAMELIEKELEIGATDLKNSDYYKQIQSNGLFTGASSKAFKAYIKESQNILKNSLQQFQQMRVVLGPAEIYSPARDFTSTFTTLGDIPVSLNYFFEFLSKKVISKEIINYPISKFIKDLSNDLITNFLNSESCGRVNNAQKLHINSTSVCAYNRAANSLGKWKPGKAPIDDITYQTVFNKQARKEGEPILLLSGKRDAPITELSIDRMINYYVFSIGRNSPSDTYVGNIEQDSDAGIFHYILGRDEGIIKNINLEKTNTPGLKEVRFEQEGFDGLTQLREVYNVTVDSFLNVQTFPGTYIYVDPKGFSPNTTEDLTRFGIGGYCMITKTTHKIGPGEASTTLNAAWVASKEGDSRDKSKPTEKRKKEGSEVQKCISRKAISQTARWDI